MIKRTDGEVQAYVDGYNACFEKFRETLLQRNVGADKAIRKMEMLKEAVNSVLLTENVGTCQRNVGEMSEKQTDGDLISREDIIIKAKEEAEGMEEPFKSNFAILVEWLVEKLPSAEKTYEDLTAEIDKLPRIKVGNSNSPTVKYCIDERLLYEIIEEMKGNIE